MSANIPTYDDIIIAANKIEGEAIKTPLMRWNILDEVTGCRVFVKPENLQRTGSFKFRGAFNAISSLSDEERSKGILASSSGNHAQGVGEVAKIFGCNATIIMPADAPTMKVDRTKAKGAKVVLYNRQTEDREAVLKRIADESGAIIVHPYNNSRVIAGQGTVGLEIAQDMNALGIKPDHAIICTGGGGLTAGAALSINHHFPDSRIYSVEPEGFDDYKRSLESGGIETNNQTSGSICDAILTPNPGSIGFEINKQLLHSGLVVTDEEALLAVKFAFEELKLVVEPAGAVALAAALKYSKKWQGETIALVISGGNIDPDVFLKAIN